MNRKSLAILALITGVGIGIRIIPSLTSYGWGNDFGIYYTITQDYIRSRLAVIDVPSPWGISGYGSFPVMYWVISVIYFFTGIKWVYLLKFVPPVFGGLTVTIIYFIAKEITKDERVAFLSAIFLAVDPVQAYQTSISSILVFGHFFGLLTILTFLTSFRNTKYFVSATVFSVLLVMSHQLSTFMYLLEMLGILAYYKLSRGSIGLYHKIYIEAFSSFMFLYWIINVKHTLGFISGGSLGIPWYITISIYFVLLTLFISLPKKYTSSLLWAIKKLRPINYKHTTKLAVLLSFVIPLAGIVLMRRYITNITGYTFAVFIPILLTVSIASVGYIVAWKKYPVLLGMLALLLVTAIYAVATMSTVLLPGRFFEYIFEILSIYDAAGLYSYIDSRRPKGIKIEYVKSNSLGARQLWDVSVGQPGIGPTAIVYSKVNSRSYQATYYYEKKRYSKSQVISAIVLFIVLIGSASAVYPLGQVVVPSGTQAISYQDEYAINWVVAHDTGNYSVLSDHRLGLMIEAYNITDPFEYASYVWNSTDYAVIVPQLLGEYKNISMHPVEFILIDNYMYKDGVWGYKGGVNPDIPPIKFTNQSFLKFVAQPFIPVYFNFSASTGDWAMVVAVNWTFISEKYHFEVPVGLLNLTFNNSVNAVQLLQIVNPALIPYYTSYYQG
ncbi:TVG0620303 [Thermoplasma volcanium GSS1]|uniref:TVG0620303 protein n=1 Tax=Thermoplasma volcanium (strain ATCC 51530 / DSM 4299 / JCM 9571 / NBRC 15438 / GSS1) TaxID=273116 RepID=Q97B32_THEVO|nr:hypothetical protein [Thermoplasma volcanium]BAB59769.1 TVG0620303 [Thermoplasma volcanium GSS1]